MTAKLSVFVPFAVICSAVLSGCRPSESGSAPPPPKVTVAKPVQTDVVDYAEFTGKTKAIEFVEIRARVRGFLQSVDFTDGSMVEKGDLLFAIEREPFQARLDAAKAKFKQTEAKLKLTEANLARAEKLVTNRTISREEYQTNVAHREAAAAELLENRADIEQAIIDLNYTVIQSPISGRVSRRLVDPGNLVGAGENTLLTTIVKMDPMYVYFDVSERVVLNLLQWQRENPDGKDENEQWKVYVGLENEDGYPHEGKIDFIDNRVDPTTGTALVRGVFPNKDGFLYPGLFVRVRVPQEIQKDALLVSERAICTDLGGKYVLVVGKDNIVQQQPVELGTLVDGKRVIRKGLSPNESYIINGLQRARPGLPVEPGAGG